VIVNVLVFAREAVLSGDAREAFVAAYALTPYDLTHGVAIPGDPPTLLTLVTAQFVHASVPHIVINMLFLAAFGPPLETALGSFRFAALYLVCGVLGGLAQTSVDPGSHLPEVGASGAIAGVLGAFVVRFPHAPSILGIPAFVVIGLWAGVQFVHGFGTLAANVLSERGGGTAYFAHIGGFLSGVFANAFARNDRRWNI
jgi:membrane associated rhomboid family serine protease